jgi:hypothetical protein
LDTCTHLVGCELANLVAREGDLELGALVLLSVLGTIDTEDLSLQVDALAKVGLR